MCGFIRQKQKYTSSKRKLGFSSKIGIEVAKKGDKVIIISKIEDIYIVQHPQTKEKFSVKKEYLNGITTS